MGFPRHHRKFLHNQSTNHCPNTIPLTIVHHQEHIHNIVHQFLIKILLSIKLVQHILLPRKFLLMFHSHNHHDHHHVQEFLTNQNTNRNINKKFINQNMYLSLNTNRKSIKNRTNMYLNQPRFHRHLLLLLLLNTMKQQLHLHDDFIHQENWISPGHLMASHTHSIKAKNVEESHTRKAL